MFTFVQETESVDFNGALELLADRCGVELEREAEDPREARAPPRTRAPAGAACAHEQLLRALPVGVSDEAARAREYLLGRGLREETLREFRVGYAPSAWDRVLSGSLRGGLHRGTSCTRPASRSARSRTGGAYDRFRARIMFPLADMRGRVLGFGARALRDDQKPKYLNTSDNTSTTRDATSTGPTSRAPTPRVRGRRSSARATPT